MRNTIVLTAIRWRLVVSADVHIDVLADAVHAHCAALHRPIAIIELWPAVALQQVPHRLYLGVLSVNYAVQ